VRPSQRRPWSELGAAPAIRAHDLEADYAALRHAVVGGGLLDRAYGYYALRGGTCLAMLAVAAALSLLLAPGPGWLAVCAILLAFAVVQVALIGHDAGHQAVLRRARANWALGLLCWSLVAGVGFWYWNDRHNRHHGHTNDADEDPDLRGEGLLAVAYTERDGASRHGWRRLAVRYQTLLVPVVVALLAIAFRVEGTLFAWRRLRGRRRLVELGLLAANAALWLAAIRELGWWGAALFLASQVVAGVYLAAIIAPNHKGMPVWAAGARLSFLQRQVLSSRNVAPHPVGDFVFGGLNYQIEHHLFPTMPRVNLGRARAIVRPFCESRGLEYTEVGPLTSYRMVYAALSGLRRSAE
jgi:fatty acid desaturase